LLIAAQAINLYGERPYLQPGLPEARDFAQAAEHSKQLTAAFRADIQKHWDELEAARKKLQARMLSWLLPLHPPDAHCLFLSMLLSSMAQAPTCAFAHPMMSAGRLGLRGIAGCCSQAGACMQVLLLAGTDPVMNSNAQTSAS
jgi:hypothetical protein